MLDMFLNFAEQIAAYNSPLNNLIVLSCQILLALILAYSIYCYKIY